MHWLESHVYLAAWLSLLVALVSLFIQNVKSNFQQIDWSRSLLYIAFLTGLAVAISPTFDERARTSGCPISRF
jgi:glucan phosphoethanolaminetransferase (alkaline phosphatase superfamily)